MELFHNGVATHFRVTPLFSMRTVWAEAWCRWALKGDLHKAKENVEVVAMLALIDDDHPVIHVRFSKVWLDPTTEFIHTSFHRYSIPIMASPNSVAKTSPSQRFLQLFVWRRFLCWLFVFNQHPVVWSFVLLAVKLKRFIYTGQFQSKFTPSESERNVADEWILNNFQFTWTKLKILKIIFAFACSLKSCSHWFQWLWKRTFSLIFGAVHSLL